MKAVMLDDFLDFSYLFDKYLKNNPILEKSSNIEFFIYNPELTAFEYTYKYGEADEKLWSIEEIKSVITETEPEFEEGYIDVHTSVEDEAVKLFLSVRNPMLEKKIYVATLCIKLDIEIPTGEVLDKLNFGYLENFLLHVESMISGYEKIFYWIDTFCEMFAVKNPHMPHHMSNVANWCTRISSELELDERQNKILYIAALLHDVGKLYIPDSIFNKPGKLDPEEVLLMKSHPAKSYHILKSTLYGMPFFNDVPEIVKYHHERYDGGGYPDGLAGEDIPYLSRILMVADSIDAMMTSKPYQGAKAVPEIMDDITRQSGKQFDPVIARAAINAIHDNYQNASTIIMKKSKFIANASLRFYFKDYKTIVSLQGNLIIKDENAIFILNSSLNYNKEWILSKIFLPTISFIENDDLYEFKCKMEHISPENVGISHIVYTPTDKFFSLVLNAEIMLKKEEDIMFVKMLKLGGDTLVFEINKADNKKIEEHFGGTFDVFFDPKLSEEIGMKSLPSRIGKSYNSGDKTIHILSYTGITSPQRDVILRFLFKKQIEYKSNLRKSKQEK